MPSKNPYYFKFLDYVLQAMIKYGDDDEVVSESVWVLGYFSDHFMKKTILYLSNLNVLNHIVDVMR